MKRLPILFFAASLCLFGAERVTAGGGKAPIKLDLVGVQKIWDKAPHNAFTSMARFQDRWYVAFREATHHGVPKVGQPGGKLRVIVSGDAETWASAALLDYGPDQDVRDASLCVTPDGRLMLNGAAAPHAHRTQRQSLVWFSKDGKTWEGPHKIGEPNWWLWGAAWGPDGKAYGVGYGPITSHPRTTRLYRSPDGIHYETIVPTLTPEPETGETALLFRRDGAAVALVRQDGSQQNGKIGIARGDYTNWTFHDLGLRIGGPAILELPSGNLVAATRLYDKPVRTALSWVNAETGDFVELLALPSGGDTSYPGLVWHDDLLWVSYYSSHEGRSKIYLARVRVK